MILFALIEPREAPRFSLFGRCVKHKPVIYTERVMSMPVLRMSVELASSGGRRNEKRIDEAAEYLLRRNIRHVLPREDFPFIESFVSRGFSVPDDGYLMKAKAGEIASAAVGLKKDAYAALYVRRFADEEKRALSALCRRFRFVMAQAQHGGRDALRQAEREYGIARISRLTDAGIKRADCAVLFSEPPEKLEFSDNCAVLALSEKAAGCVTGGRLVKNAEFYFPEGFKVPAGYPAAGIISAAAELGLVQIAEISVKSVETVPFIGK